MEPVSWCNLWFDAHSNKVKKWFNSAKDMKKQYENLASKNGSIWLKILKIDMNDTRYSGILMLLFTYGEHPG